MKRQILTISFCLFSVFLMAQQPATLPNDASAKEGFTLFSKDTWMGRFQKGQQKIVVKIGLDEAQRRSLDTLNDVYVSQRAAFYDDKNLDRRDRKADIKQLQKERYDKFISLLSPEQLKKWNDLRKGQKKKVLRKK
jgi:Spy/CpxP family protein refolding chaperone